MVEDRTRKRLPPYVSYRTFRNFIEGLQSGMPARIDRSYWGDKCSGSNGTQAVSALFFMGLIDMTGVPNPQLKQLVSARGPVRAEILKQVSTARFSFLLQSSFDPTTATYAQLEEAFKNEYQIAGDVARKCTKFFIGLAGDAGIPLSPFIIRKSGTVHSGSGTKKSGKKSHGRTNRNLQIPEKMDEIPNIISMDKLLITKFPTFDPTWPDEVKLKWFEAFDVLLKRSTTHG